MESSSVALVGFNNPIHSNWKLEIIVEAADCSEEPEPKKLKCSEPQSTGKTVLYVSSVPLSTQSDFFRRKIEGWAKEGSEKVIRVTVKPGEEGYLNELVRFMYTQEIPFVKGADIIKLLFLANQLLVPACEAKCIRLLKEGALTLEVALQLCHAHEHAPFTAELLSSVEPALMEKYGNFEDVCASAELRDTFLELPLRMVEILPNHDYNQVHWLQRGLFICGSWSRLWHWAKGNVQLVLLGSDDLVLVTENTAFTAAAMWLHHNEQALGDGVEAAWGALTRRLRFVCMTPLFLVDVVMRVPWKWWKEKASLVTKAMKMQTLSRYNVEIFLGKLSLKERQQYIPRAPKDFVCTDYTIIEWTVPASELDGLRECSHEKLECLYSIPTFVSGYLLNVGICRLDNKLMGGISLGGPALDFVKFPDDSPDGGASLDLARLNINVHGSTPSYANYDVHRNGLFVLGHYCFTDLPGIELEAGSILSQKLEAKGFLKDGHLHLTTEIGLSMGSAKVKHRF